MASSIIIKKQFVSAVYENESLIASIFFTRLKFDNPMEVYMLAPVAVSTEYQGKGIGQALINYGLNELKKRSCKCCGHIWRSILLFKGRISIAFRKCNSAPLKLSMPFGWLGQSLTEEPIPTINERPVCVKEFNDPVYW